MKHMLLFGAALFVAYLLVDVANAAPLTVNYQWSTVYADGTSIDLNGPDAPLTVRVEYGTCTGTNLDQFGIARGQGSQTYPATSISFPDVGTGIVCVRAFQKGALGVESAASNVGRYVPAPKAPTLVSTTKVAYELQRKSDGDYQFVSVGTVPLGAKCGQKLVGNYLEVNGAKITKPLTGGVIAARCG